MMALVSVEHKAFVSEPVALTTRPLLYYRSLCIIDLVVALTDENRELRISQNQQKLTKRRLEARRGD